MGGGAAQPGFLDTRNLRRIIPRESLNAELDRNFPSPYIITHKMERKEDPAIAFTDSFNHLFKTRYVPGPILSTRDIAVKTKPLSICSAVQLQGPEHLAR